MSKEKDLGTKYLKILTTKAQREIIQTAIKDVMYRYDVKEGRATELIAADYLAGIGHPIVKDEYLKEK
jgi:hypothetical protein